MSNTQIKEKIQLPDLSTELPTYSLNLPSDNREIKYQPFMRRDEKALIIAQNEGDPVILFETMNNLIRKCCGLDEDLVYLVDYVYVMSHLKAKSVGSEHSFIISECACGHKNLEIKVNDFLKNLKIKNKDNLKSVCKISDKLSLKLVPLKVDSFKDLQDVNTEEDFVDKLLINSIDYVLYDGKVLKDYTDKEIKEKILDTLLNVQLKKINNEIENLIMLNFEFDYVCPTCKKEFKKEFPYFLS